MRWTADARGFAGLFARGADICYNRTMTSVPLTNGYEKTYALLRTRLAACDFSAAAVNLGLSAPENGVLRLSFLGRQWRADAAGVYLERGADAHVNCKSVIVYYLTFGGRGAPQYRFQLLHAFTGGFFAWQNSAWSAERGRTTLTAHAPFAAAAKRLGARPVGEARGVYTWMLFAFPKLPVQITYAEPDEDFPPKLLIKFDCTAADFLRFETLAVLHGLIAAELEQKQ
jgi:hypothetical protein